MSLQVIDQRLKQPFGDVFQGTVRGQKVTVSNCADYLRLSAEGFEPNGVQAAQILHSDGVKCEALSLLRAGRAPRIGAMAGFQMTVNALSMLPAELAPAVSNEVIAQEKAADASGGTWQSFAPKSQVKVLSPWRITVTQPNWSTQLTVYARGDFSGSGADEVLIRADYHALQGTYGNSKLFLLKPGLKLGRWQLVREIAVP